MKVKAVSHLAYRLSLMSNLPYGTSLIAAPSFTMDPRILVAPIEPIGLMWYLTVL